MATIDDYIRNPDQALIDALLEPGLKPYIEPDDIEPITVTEGGAQRQIQALSKKGAAAVVRRIVARAKTVGIDIHHWICSPDEFDLCKKLKTTTPGKAMRELDAFLKHKWTEAGVNGFSVVTIFIDPVAGTCLTILCGLGYVNKIFVEMCNCP